MSGEDPQHSSRGKSPDEQIKDKLKSGGLDPSHWFKVFKDELQVNIPEEMESIGEESYEDLVKHIRKAREKKALMKFLGMSMPEESSPSKPEHKDTDEQIKEKLKSAGLDPSYWLAIVKDELKVNIPEELEAIGEESYQDLAKYIRKAREKRPLRKFLGMPEDEQSSLNPKCEKKREEFKKYEKAEALLQQLKQLEKQGKDRHESAVKHIENGICEVLKIPPDVWIPEDKSLGELTTSLQVCMDQLSSELKKRKDGSNATVLENASGGCALQGVLVSRNAEDWLKIRERLLRAPKDVHFTDPSLPQVDKVDTFSCKLKENNFCKTVERLGYNAAVSGYKSFGEEVHVSFSNDAENEDCLQYNSTVKYSFVPMASFLFEDAQLQLSQEALQDLKSIEDILSKTSEHDLQMYCEAFFERYGSHANKGYFHFGGIYWWKCYSQGFKTSEMEQVKDLQSQVVTALVRASYGPWSVGASVGGDWSRLISEVMGNCSETLRSQTHLFITQTGGPPEVTDLLQWKNGLVASNSTWSVIDHGTNAVPVWKIIQVWHYEV